MPRDYVAIRNRLMAEGKTAKLAKRHAAMITNALRRKEGKPPMAPHREK